MPKIAANTSPNMVSNVTNIASLRKCVSRLYLALLNIEMTDDTKSDQVRNTSWAAENQQFVSSKISLQSIVGKRSWIEKS